VAKADLALGAAKRAGKDTALAFADGDDLTARTTFDVLYRELRERMGESGLRDAALRELWNAGRALARESTREGLLQAAAMHLATLLRATACLVSRLEDGRLVDGASHATPPWRVDQGTAFLVEDYPQTAEVLESGEPRAVALSDEQVDESEAFVLRKLGMHSVLMLRLRVRDRAWGLVEVYDARERTFDGTDVALAELLLGHLEVSLAQLEHAEAVERLYRDALASLANAVEAKGVLGERHAQEVAELSGAVARRLAFPSGLVHAVELAGLLHDVGKVAVPESVLGKPGPLTEAERALVRGHSEAGSELLARVEPLEGVASIVRSSHERWDGGGYPDGLRAQAIPVGARIVAACDAFCALVEPRPHRPALGADAALVELELNAGTQFDPAVVDALRQALATRDANAETVELWRPDHLLGAAG
jgi:HD domain/GAF domain